MWSLMLVAAAGLTPSAPDAAAHAAAPQAPAAVPLVFDTWTPGPCSPNGQPQGQCAPGDLFRVRLAPVADGLRSPRNIAFTPDGGILIAEQAGRVRIVRGGALLPEPLAGPIARCRL
jgi:glucose/arabinose dehydrogenase